MLFLGKAYYVSNVQEAVRIVTFDEQSMDIKNIKIIRKKDFKEYYNSVLSIKKDFNYNENSNEFTSNNMNACREDISTIYGVPASYDKDYVNEIMSLYGLLKTLADINALYYEEVLGSITYNSFRGLKVSNSTMILGISLMVDNIWVSRKLLEYSNNGITQYPFKVAVPKNKITYVEGFDLETIGSLTLNNVEYVLMEYTCNLPVCNTMAGYMLDTPILCYVSYLSYLYFNCIKVLKVFNNKFLNNQSKLMKDPDSLRLKSKDILCADGVTIYCTCKNLSDDRANELIDIIKDEFRQYSEISTKHIEMILKAKMGPDIEECAIPIGNLIYKCLTYGKKYGMVELISFLSKSISEYYYKYLKMNLYLYNVRVTCIFDTDLIDFVFTEDKLDNSTLVKRSGI